MSAPKRIQLRRTKGWRKPDGAIVVSRPSKWGNPIKADEIRFPYSDRVTPFMRRQAATAMFRMLIEDGYPAIPNVIEIRAELAGHDLACWCPLNQPCHADVLLVLANGDEL